MVLDALQCNDTVDHPKCTSVRLPNYPVLDCCFLLLLFSHLCYCFLRYRHHMLTTLNPLQHKFPPEYEGHFDGVLLEAATIRKRIRELAQAIHHDYSGRRILLLCILKGAATFTVHLMEALQACKQGLEVEFARASSYEGTQSTGKVYWTGLDELKNYQNRHILIVEDILDTGTTLADLLPRLEEVARPASVNICTLLDKRLEEGVVKKCKAQYVGFTIPNKFIIGYGLDYNELYRDLSDIFVISQKGIDFDPKQLY
jgi:hypoxanthine phosphoribosyltransferase